MKITRTEMDQLLNSSGFTYRSIARIAGVTDYELKQYLFNDRKLNPSESLRIDICVKALRQSVATVPNAGDMHEYFVKKAKKGRVRQRLSVYSCIERCESNLRTVVEREVYRREQKAINVIMQIAECSGE